MAQAVFSKFAIADLFGQAGTVANPPVGYARLYYNSLANTLVCVDSNGTSLLTGGGGGVTTVFGRSGAVVATSGDYTLDQIGSAAGAVTWNNATNAITINNTSAVTQTFANTTAAISSVSQSSPLIKLAGTYWTGAASAIDNYTLQTVIANGTNGTSFLYATHTGSTGQGGVVSVGSGGGFFVPAVTTGSQVTGIMTGGGVFVNMMSNGSAVGRWGSSGIQAVSAAGFGFTDTSSFNDTFATRVSSGLFSIGTSGSGSLNLTNLNASGTVAGLTYTANSTAGVSAGSFSAITAITTVGGIVTQLTGTSDERLKDATDYTDGLSAINLITPVRYQWNADGQFHTGLSGDRTYVGFLAQNVQSAIPEAITATEKSKANPSTEYLSLDDRPIIAALVNAVKELSARLERLENS